VAKALGFDPENPLVKIEVSRIAGRFSSSRAPSVSYQELALSADPTPTAGDAPTVGSLNLKNGSRGAPPGRPAAETVPPVGSTSVLSRALIFLAALAALTVSAGLFLFWQAARGRPK
jgi:hypothetical protein